MQPPPQATASGSNASADNVWGCIVGSVLTPGAWDAVAYVTGASERTVRLGTYPHADEARRALRVGIQWMKAQSPEAIERAAAATAANPSYAALAPAPPPPNPALALLSQLNGQLPYLQQLASSLSSLSPLLSPLLSNVLAALPANGPNGHARPAPPHYPPQPHALRHQPPAVARQPPQPAQRRGRARAQGAPAAAPRAAAAAPARGGIAAQRFQAAGHAFTAPAAPGPYRPAVPTAPAGRAGPPPQPAPLVLPLHINIPAIPLAPAPAPAPVPAPDPAPTAPSGSPAPLPPATGEVAGECGELGCCSGVPGPEEVEALSFTELDVGALDIIDELSAASPAYSSEGPLSDLPSPASDASSLPADHRPFPLDAL
eukprot:tig00000823_g4539.t1